MNMLRRTWFTGLLAAVTLLAGCAVTPPPASPPTPQARAALAPDGKLRVGVYSGSPTSMVTDKNGKLTGVAYELGRELARWLNVPLELVEYKRIAEVLEAMKNGEVDFTFTNATEARARDMNFTLPLVSLELGYLVPAGSPLQSASEIDRVGIKVGVSQGSTSQGVLTRTYKQAQVVPVPTLKAASEQLAARKFDAFATNKGILYEMADGLPGARVLDGRWGLENLAIAIPKGREAGLSYLSSFALTVRRDGTLQSAIDRAGLRGTAEPAMR
ncbi:transporter substrate-binding domain-containing protein [Rhodoferax sp. BAB1]|uniref:transporter substrate-binding domain-containing protein n=1 Tax=Rhodoferax sp. BAB1 TaxID=2741720 RepID=UPI00157626AC|nr:transporter substrate-binding domain-containing protein [Rhodoferax sp. BAB1]QKO22191.1 transporter substrate-binding domain-containing protein [Rhodoferax sp. BAB1]